MVGQHSEFGGSSIGRVMACPGSVALLRTVPPAPSSVYAEEGTLAHAFAECFVAEDERNCLQHVGATLDGTVGAKPLTKEMAEAIQVYLDAVFAEFDLTEDAELYVEKSFELELRSAKPGEVHGRNDALVYHPSTGRLRVFDYKHGVGVSVSAEDSPQLKFYAAGAVFSNPWPVSEVVLTIVQPRARDADEAGKVKDWRFDTVDLLEFKEEVDAAVAKAKESDAPVDVGDHCRWCAAAVVCPARRDQALADFSGIDVETVTVSDLPEPRTLEPERLSRIVAGLDLLQSWANQCREYMEALLLAGTPVPGWKVVEKIGRAKWISDEEAVASTLSMLYDLSEDLVRPRKLVTIGDAEKLLKGAGASKEEIVNFKLTHTLKESSGLTVAPESDRRPAVDAAKRAFGDVDIKAP